MLGGLGIQGLGVPALGSGAASIDLIERFKTLNGGSYPSYVHPSTSYVSQAAGQVSSTTGWSSATASFAGGDVAFPASASSQTATWSPLATSLASGERAHFTWLQSAGTCGVRLYAGNVADTTGYLARPGWFSKIVSITGTRTSLILGARGDSLTANLDNMCIEKVSFTSTLYDSTAFDIIVLAGQSNMSPLGAGAPDLTIDLPHKDVYMLPGVTASGYATTVAYDSGTDTLTPANICGAREPLQHRSAAVDSMGPGLAFARWYADNMLASGRKVLLVCAAQGGSSLTQTNGGWNWSGGSPTLYTWMAGATKKAVAMNASNRIVRFVWCQGEADGTSGYAAKFADFAAQLRTEFSEPNLPITILGLNPDAYPNDPTSRATHLAKIALQEKLDADSGDATAVTGVKYVGWQSAWGNGTKASPDDEGDTVHFSQNAHRVRGIDGAQQSYDGWVGYGNDY